MLVQFLRYGRGKSAGPLGYLTGDYSPGKDGQEPKMRNIKPEIVRGDSKTVAGLIDGIERKWKYTSGVLSWAPGEMVTPEAEEKIMDGFEKHSFAGLDQDRYSVLWVRHQHAGHHELHFLIPRVELISGLNLNIRPPGEKKIKKYFDNWRTVQNLENGWSDPGDPSRRRDYSEGHDSARLRAEAVRSGKTKVKAVREQIGDYIVAQGPVNKDQVVKILKDLGYTITRRGKDSISIKSGQDKRAIKLRGRIYSEEHFYLSVPPKEWDREKILKKAKEDLHAGFESRKENYQKYYPAPEPLEVNKNLEVIENELKLDDFKTHGADGNALQQGIRAIIESNEAISRTCGRPRNEPSRNSENELREHQNPNPKMGNTMGRESGNDGKTGRKQRGNERISRVIDKILSRFGPQIERVISSVGRGVDRIKSRIQRSRFGPDQRLKDTIRIFKEGLDQNRRAARKIQGYADKYDQLGVCLDELKGYNIKGVLVEDRASELDDFKRNIDLVQYAISEGFQVNKKESSTGSKKLRNGVETIVVTRKSTGHWVYSSVHNAKSGTIIDFVQNERNVNLGEVRKELRRWS